MQKTTHMRLLYGIKRFAVYMLVGIILNLMPTPELAIFTLPSIFIASLVLALADAYSLQDLSTLTQTPPVFNRIRTLFLISIALLVTALDIMAWYFEFAFFDFYFFQMFASILATIGFFSCFYYDTKNRRAYAYKRFAAYLLVGFFAAMIPIIVFVIFGAPTILMAAVLMASIDTMSLPPSATNPFDSDPCPVFTRAYLRISLPLVLLGTICVVITLMRHA